MIYEEKILDYLDGALGDKESAELMHQLSVSPERRVILEQHLQLKNTISDARTPFQIPAEIERRLAERIPAIANYERDVATGVIATNSVPLFYRTAAVVAGLLLIGNIVYFGFLRKASLESSQVSQRASNPEQVQPTDVRTPGSGQEISDKLSFPPLEANNSVTRTEVRSARIPGVARTRKPVGVDRTSGADEMPSAISSSPTVNAVELLASVEEAHPRTTSIVVVQDVQSRMPAMRMPTEQNSSLPLVLRLDYSIGQGYNQVRETDASLTTHDAMAPSLGVDYIVSPRIAIGVEAGKTDISRVQEIASLTDDALLGIKRVNVSHDVISHREYNVRGMFRYTFNPYDRVRLESSIGAGLAFGDSPAPLVSFSTMWNYNLIENVGFTAGFSFTGTFARSEAAPSATDVMGPIAYVNADQASASTLFTPNFLFKVGVRITP